MPKPKDYYELLGVDRGASADQIRSAYRKLARKYHPDVNKAADASKRFAEVQEAYDVLSDPEKRKAYDQFGHAGVGAAGRAGPSAPGPGSEGFYRGGPQSWTHVDTGGFEGVDVESIFEQMFGGGAGGPSGGFSGGGAGGGGGARAGRGGFGGSPFGGAGTRSRGNRASPQRGTDIEHTISVSFMTAATGGTEQLRLGAVNGSGEPQTISVKIPAGVESGAKLRIRGKGQVGLAGGGPGDIILTVQVGQHPYFKREGLDLIIDVPITIAEAVTGTSVVVPLLGGGTVQIKVPPGASSNRRLRVRSKGISDSKGRTGDYYAVIQIVAPAASELSERARSALNQVGSELKNPRESAPWADVVRS